MVCPFLYNRGEIIFILSKMRRGKFHADVGHVVRDKRDEFLDERGRMVFLKVEQANKELDKAAGK